MISPTKRALYIALSSTWTLAPMGADAVNVSADGRGQVLLYPYYTTRADGTGNAFATLLSVVNGTASAKAVRVRFLEGKNGREVLDFNLFLSPFDVWTAGILPDTTSGGARVGTADASCTLPSFSSASSAPFVSFVNYAFTGASDDQGGSGLDRTKEGYFEIIEMATYASSSVTGKAITHVNGVPPCGSPSNQGFPPFPNNPMTDAQAAIDALPPTGGLFGSGTLINVNTGTDYTFDAVALANFYQSGSDYQSPGASLPDLTQAVPPVSSIQAPNGALYESLWTAGSADAVSAVLMHDSVMNEFVLDTATKSGTDWVMTMPTKRHYVAGGIGSPSRLFQRNFNGTAGSCDDVKVTFWDREERFFDPNGPAPVGLPPSPQASIVCWAANVVGFDSNGAASTVFGSTNLLNLISPFQDGWATAGFPTNIPGAAANVHRLINNGSTTISGGGNAATTGNTATYIGLPIIGFAVVSFTNGTLQIGTPPVTVLSSYGGNFTHKTSTTIQ